MALRPAQGAARPGAGPALGEITRRGAILVALGVFCASLFYSDIVITPANFLRPIAGGHGGVRL